MSQSYGKLASLMIDRGLLACGWIKLLVTRASGNLGVEGEPLYHRLTVPKGSEDDFSLSRNSRTKTTQLADTER